MCLWVSSKSKVFLTALPTETDYKELLRTTVFNLDNRNCMLHECEHCLVQHGLKTSPTHLFENEDKTVSLNFHGRILVSILTLNWIKIYLKWWFFLMNHTNTFLKNMISPCCWLFTWNSTITTRNIQKSVFLHFMAVFDPKFDSKFCPNTPEMEGFFAWILYLFLAFGCPMVNFGPSLRGWQPHSPNINHCYYFFSFVNLEVT